GRRSCRRAYQGRSNPAGCGQLVSGQVRVETADSVAAVTLDRPPVNALSSGFYAGADVTELAALSGTDAEAADARRQELARRVFGQLMELPQPSIAVLDGPAIGAGAVIASCAGIRMGSARARFALPELSAGRCGGGRHLMRHLPQGIVRRMFFTGQPLLSEEALRFGFLDSVHDRGELADAAMARARDIAANSPLALRLGKAALNESEPLPVQEGYAVEQQYTLRLAGPADAREALAARREKRAPRFTGR